MPWQVALHNATPTTQENSMDGEQAQIDRLVRKFKQLPVESRKRVLEEIREKEGHGDRRDNH
jgi:hypothetical protein